MWIQVTAKDIANGKPGFAGQCPVALAIKRRLNPKTIAVGTDRILLSQGGGLKRYNLSPRMQKWVSEFDTTGKQLPVRFELVEQPLQVSPYQ